jgi:copper chaperone
MEEGVVEASSDPQPAATGDLTSVELVVGGMHCPSCAALIEETLVREPGVHGATVDLDASRATVTFDGSARSVRDLCASVVSVGYSASPLSTADPTS